MVIGSGFIDLKAVFLVDMQGSFVIRIHTQSIVITAAVGNYSSAVVLTVTAVAPYSCSKVSSVADCNRLFVSDRQSVFVRQAIERLSLEPAGMR